LHIISEILEKCKKGQTRTGIMRSLNISHKMRVSYLAELEYTKLIETPSNIPSKHITTPKGLEYLKKFRELQNIADFSAVNCDLDKDGSKKRF
jgi:predicted transcriptional regulator